MNSGIHDTSPIIIIIMQRHTCQGLGPDWVTFDWESVGLQGYQGQIRILTYIEYTALPGAVLVDIAGGSVGIVKLHRYKPVESCVLCVHLFPATASDCTYTMIYSIYSKLIRRVTVGYPFYGPEA